MNYFTDLAFLPHGWAENVLITVNQEGWITDLQVNAKNHDATRLTGTVLPGMPNLHSHAFQRAMAGLAERATSNQDSFWTWRETMYRFLEKITPNDLQAIAAQLYVEMLKAGYTSVAEFHYLHHQPDGKPYPDRALNAHHLVAAAKEAGIALTILPTLYAYSNFGEQPPNAGQKRFINNEEDILVIREALKKDYKLESQVTVGLALHSLRAVSQSMLESVLKSVQHSPVHIHIAEQIKEVDDCLAFCGQRPVEWLLTHAKVDKHWCLVHATHMTAEETSALALTGAVAGLCPTTEANLGDGLFNFQDYLRHGGRFGIGSDSQISVSMIEELRWLEYGQRLLHHQRVISATPTQPSVGAFLYQQALAGGTQALGRPAGSLEIGKRADFIVLDADSPILLGKEKDSILDALIFAGNINPVRHVIAGGKQVVKDFRHMNEEVIYEQYKKALRAIST